jgi:hypothetical protein
LVGGSRASSINKLPQHDKKRNNDENDNIHAAATAVADSIPTCYQLAIVVNNISDADDDNLLATAKRWK